MLVYSFNKETKIVNIKITDKNNYENCYEFNISKTEDLLLYTRFVNQISESVKEYNHDNTKEEYIVNAQGLSIIVLNKDMKELQRSILEMNKEVLQYIK